MVHISPSCNCESCIFRKLLFEDLDIPELEIICRSRKEVSFTKGQDIVEEGQPIKEFLYLKNGLVKLFKKNEQHKEQIISIAKPFDFIGLLTVFSEKNYNYSVTAIEDTQVCLVDLEAVKSLVRSNGRFALSLLGKISQMSDKIINTNLEISKKNLKGRIAYILLYFSAYIYSSDSFDLPVSRKEIAGLIEMTTENVIRTFSEFRKDKLISISGKTITLIDKHRLQKISELG